MSQSQSRFDAASIPFWLLREGDGALFRTSPELDQATDIVLAEAVRRYIRNDTTPPGGEDQLQQFDTRNILDAFELAHFGSELDAILGDLSDRGLVTIDVPEAGIQAEEGFFFLAPAGIERGLALLDHFVPADPSPDPNDGEMEDLLLRYFIKDDRAVRGTQPLTAIFGHVRRPASGWQGAFFDELKTPEEKRALWVLLERLARRRLLQKRHPNGDEEPGFEANDRAIRRYFSRQALDGGDQRGPGDQFDEADQSNGAGEPDQPTDTLNDLAVGDNEPLRPEPIRFDSRSWTGLTHVPVTHRNAQAISRLIDTALGTLGADGNAKTAQARALLLAAKELTDAPEPPSDIIWELIQRAGAGVGLLDLFFRIFVAIVVDPLSGMP